MTTKTLPQIPPTTGNNALLDVRNTNTDTYIADIEAWYVTSRDIENYMQ